MKKPTCETLCYALSLPSLPHESPGKLTRGQTNIHETSRTLTTYSLLYTFPKVSLSAVHSFTELTYPKGYQRFLHTTLGHYSENPYLITLIFWIVPRGLCLEIPGTAHSSEQIAVICKHFWNIVYGQDQPFVFECWHPTHGSMGFTHVYVIHRDNVQCAVVKLWNANSVAKGSILNSNQLDPFASKLMIKGFIYVTTTKLKAFCYIVSQFTLS